MQFVNQAATFVTAAKDMVQRLVATCVLLFSDAGVLITSYTIPAASVLRSPVQLVSFNNHLNNHIVVQYATM